jgi:hypothetical protein
MIKMSEYDHEIELSNDELIGATITNVEFNKGYPWTVLTMLLKDGRCFKARAFRGDDDYMIATWIGFYNSEQVEK